MSATREPSLGAPSCTRLTPSLYPRCTTASSPPELHDSPARRESARYSRALDFRLKALMHDFEIKEPLHEPLPGSADFQSAVSQNCILQAKLSFQSVHDRNARSQIKEPFHEPALGAPSCTRLKAPCYLRFLGAWNLSQGSLNFTRLFPLTSRRLSPISRC
jgi:hypothetical protein